MFDNEPSYLVDGGWTEKERNRKFSNQSINQSCRNEKGKEPMLPTVNNKKKGKVSSGASGVLANE